ncbi:AraC family transcriptional regulator [Chryseobacterium sp. ISL-6]|uniref:helix-turn-helix domain-containing protein n=1 Tax=Chryseobacterium sp. ISL-6 TaxID=2819143 RepID=UPI001BE85184|nr:AraC family transcriptional regulator [Chryseobacterium sp. ISL-6]MBT2619429.1 helix-turn-helix transcriptional regulator [Chryseobacterium sp. ISL-6]
MNKENIDRLVDVEYCKTEKCPVRNLQFSFFQMVYVISGSGFLEINDNKVTYNKGSLIMLTPNDQHYFDISEISEFLFVKFSENYVREYNWKSINCIECLLYHASHLSGCVLKNKPDEFLVKSIVDSLLHNMKHHDLYQEDLTLHYVNALIVIAARNISKMRPVNATVNSDKRMLSIIGHIQTHIYEPQQLKASVISKKFGLSETYLGSYFKNQCGETIQNYIYNYKMRLIEHRLMFSDMRINEIVNEFGFADESHLNKFFKKRHKISLTEFRKSKQTVKEMV